MPEIKDNLISSEKANDIKDRKFDRRAEVVNALTELLAQGNITRLKIENFLSSIRLITDSGTEIPLGLNEMEKWDNERFLEEVGKLILALKKENRDFISEEEHQQILSELKARAELLPLCKTASFSDVLNAMG